MEDTSLLRRQWVLTEKNDRTSPDVGSLIRFGAFNALADELAQNGGFMHIKDENTLSWDTRSPRLLAVIAQINPDVLSLVECDHYEDLWKPALASMGLDQSCWVQKKNATHGHGVAWFFRSDKFEPQMRGKSIYHGHPNEEAPMIYTLDDGVAAVCLKLTVKQSGKQIQLINTHLKAKQQAPVRFQQVVKILEFCQHIGFDMTGEIPTIFAGDFNTSLGERSMQLLMQDMKLKPAVHYEWTTWKERKVTDWNKGGLVRHAIDHFLITGNGTIIVHSYLDVPADEEVIEAGLLPGQKYPSDHLAIAMNIHLN